jgi:proteasome accessory factor C
VKISTAEKLQRLISIVSWINEQDGPLVAEVCDRFSIDRAELVAQLDMASLVGADSEDYGDMPIEVWYEDDRVHVFLTAFQRPLRLTPEQGLALLAAGVGRQQTTALEDDGPLDRALAKLATVLGIEPGDMIEVDLGDADAAVLDRLRAAVAASTPVELDYWSAGRDHRTHRVVEPWRVFNQAGAWYLQAWCRMAEAERLFRVDRMHAVEDVDGTFTPPKDLPAAEAYRAAAEDPRIVLDLAPEARWVATTYAVDLAEEQPGGRLRVTLPAGGPAFLARLLLTLGPDAVVVEAGDRTGGTALAADAARRILARYGEVPPEP